MINDEIGGAAVTLEEYIRSKLTKNLDGEFLFDAWVEGDSLRILFIHYGENEDSSHGFIVVGNTVVPMRGDEGNGTNVRD